MLVVSDTSDRIRLGRQPSLARCFVEVSDSTITSFSWLVIEIDTAKNSRAKSATNLVPTGRKPCLVCARGRQALKISSISSEMTALAFLSIIGKAERSPACHQTGEFDATLLAGASAAGHRARASRSFCRVSSSTLALFFICLRPNAFLFRYRSFMRARQCARFLAYQRAKRRLLLAFAPGEWGSLNGILLRSFSHSCGLRRCSLKLFSAIFKLNFDTSVVISFSLVYNCRVIG